MHTLKGLSDENSKVYNPMGNCIKFSFCPIANVARMKRCRLCYEKTHKNNAYCSTQCKEVWKGVKIAVRAQRKLAGFVPKCSTCKKILSEDEGKYCTRCLTRAKEVREKNARTDFFRPCKQCGIDMLNPAPNKKWCEKCAIPIKRKDKAERTRVSRAKTKKVKVVLPKVKKEKPSGIDPKWLTRGKISDNSRASRMAC